MRLAEQSGVSQGNINGFLNGKNKVENMTLGTLLRLFPQLDMKFFGEHGKAAPEAEDQVERKIMEFVKALTPDEKLDCLMLIAARFSSKLTGKEEDHGETTE